MRKSIGYKKREDKLKNKNKNRENAGKIGTKTKK